MADSWAEPLRTASQPSAIDHDGGLEPQAGLHGLAVRRAVVAGVITLLTRADPADRAPCGVTIREHDEAALVVPVDPVLIDPVRELLLDNTASPDTPVVVSRPVGIAGADVDPPGLHHVPAAVRDRVHLRGGLDGSQ